MSVLREESAVSRAPGLDQLMVAAKRRYTAVIVEEVSGAAGARKQP
jgi:hypothetical protein